MATVITEECINCGACEPECPNTAIYQGGVEYELDGKKHPPLKAEIFYIVPEKCTECVGFYDYEACAAVCPVDCCVPDPERPESEEVLIERAKTLHPDKEFGGEFPSRFRKKTEEPAAGSSGTDDAAPEAPATAAVSAGAAPELPSTDPEDFDVPLICETCGGEYAVAFRYLTPGLVLRCPHCGVSFTATERLYLAVRDRLARFSEMLSAEIDRHLRALEAEQALFDENVVDIHESTARELRRLVEAEVTPRKRSVFG